MQIVEIRTISIGESLNDDLLKPFAPFFTFRCIQDQRDHIAQRCIAIRTKTIGVVAKTACLAEVDAVVLTVHSDGSVFVVRCDLEAFTKRANILRADLVCLGGLVDAFGDG